jgi:hypothetical protein
LQIGLDIILKDKGQNVSFDTDLGSRLVILTFSRIFNFQNIQFPTSLMKISFATKDIANVSQTAPANQSTVLLLN